MNFSKPQKLTIVSLVYWVLLLYMVAALAWWFIALENQNQAITLLRLQELKEGINTNRNSIQKIEALKERKTAQYIGEGVTFLVLILIGAVFVFRATRRQLRLSQQQQNFMMAITHELKTPIAITQLNLETLQKRQLGEETKQKLISNTLQEANRLNNLCNNVLFASQLDTGVYAAAEQHLHFTDIAESCVDDFRSRFPQRIVQESIEQDVYINGEPLLIQLLISNLIENANKYSPKEKPLHVTLSQNGTSIKLDVADEGLGIADHEKKKIFDKFYRIGNENTRRAKGTGLGLYLCYKIAEKHHASIEVRDNIPSGSIFTVIFRKA